MSTELLTKSQIVEQFKDRYGLDISNKLIMKICEYDAGGFAPEPRSYKLSFISQFSGKRERLMYWPNTVGYQGI